MDKSLSAGQDCTFHFSQKLHLSSSINRFIIPPKFYHFQTFVFDVEVVSVFVITPAPKDREPCGPQVQACTQNDPEKDLR